MKKRIALLTALLLIVPMVLTGCMTSEERAAQREKFDEIGKLAEEYMTEKYDRLFSVKKCEYAVGDEYEGDFFITFTDSTHAYYDTDEEKFYDDRQANKINEDIFHELWMPMIEELGEYDSVGDWSQTFCMKYMYHTADSTFKYSMFHEFYSGDIRYFANREGLSVDSDNLIIINDYSQAYVKYYSYISEYLEKRFKNQSNGKLTFYVVTSEYHNDPNFESSEVDVTVDGCIARLQFSEKDSVTVNKYVKASDGLYAMLCSDDGVTFEDDDIKLVPVSDSEATEQSILSAMEQNSEGLIDKYILKKRNISFETPIYRVEFSDRISEMSYESVTLAFAMKENEEPVYKYVKIDEKQRSFFAYDMSGKEYNAQCLCSKGSRPGTITLNSDSDVYLWFGTQS